MESITPGAAEAYSQRDVVEYFDAVEAADVRSHAGKDAEVAIAWHGDNQREVFVHLLEHGWAVTSMSEGYVWLEQLDKSVTNAPDSIWRAPRDDPFNDDLTDEYEQVREFEACGYHLLAMPERVYEQVFPDWVGHVVRVGDENDGTPYEDLAAAYVEAGE